MFNCHTYEFLDRLGVEFDRTDHPDQPATSMEVCADVDAILNVHICKNLFLCNRQKTNFYLLIMPGDKPFKTKELSKQMGISRLSFADEKYMEQFLDIHPGSVSVLGLMNDRDHRVTLAIDEDVLKEEMFDFPEEKPGKPIWKLNLERQSGKWVRYDCTLFFHPVFLLVYLWGNR